MQVIAPREERTGPESASPMSGAMTGDTGATIRNAGFLVLQRGFHAAGGLLFAILIPRVMGPDRKSVV